MWEKLKGKGYLSINLHCKNIVEEKNEISAFFRPSFFSQVNL